MAPITGIKNVLLPPGPLPAELMPDIAELSGRGTKITSLWPGDGEGAVTKINAGWPLKISAAGELWRDEGYSGTGRDALSWNIQWPDFALETGADCGFIRIFAGKEGRIKRFDIINRRDKFFSMRI